jgi:hypothetical protein
MTLADVLAVVSGLSIAGAGFASMSVILSLFAPRAVERARGRIANRMGRSFLLGLLLFLAVLTVAGRLLKAAWPGAHIAALALILCGFSLAALGGVAMASALARRARAGSAAEVPLTLRDLLRGVFLLETAVLLPIVGWFVLLPTTFFISLGAGLHSALRRGASASAVTAPAAGV